VATRRIFGSIALVSALARASLPGLAVPDVCIITSSTLPVEGTSAGASWQGLSGQKPQCDELELNDELAGSLWTRVEAHRQVETK